MHKYTKIRRSTCILDINGLVPYPLVWDLQKQIVQNKINGNLLHDVLIILEHKPVFTIGKNGSISNLKIENFNLQMNNIELYHIERGGDITYHGPGQVVAYPIFNIRSPRLSIKEFVYLLEEVMLQVASNFGVSLNRNDLNRGVWYKNKKIGSIGIAVKRGITYHGLAFNVNNDLSPFNWINPCGLKNIEMTSLMDILGQKVDIKKIKELMIQSFLELFKLDITETKQILDGELFHAINYTKDKKTILA